ncbi:MAG: iron permease [Coprothermobacter sp.]|nr:iron permease [Coprothermobacter sp.]
MLNTFIIALREGVEIAVVLAIILAYLHQLGAGRSASKVWLGTAAAAIVSVAAAVGIFAVLHTTEVERFQAPLEGSLKFLAVIILTWMTLWMKRESGAIGSGLRQRVLHAVSDGSVWMLASLAFISVIREGIETVLFVVGSTQQASPAATISGAVLGFAVAAVLGGIVYGGSRQLALKPFFTVTSVLLIVMAAGLLVGGVGEFQGLGLLPTGVAPLWSTRTLLSDTSIIGGLLSSIFGYTDSPNLVQVVAWIAYLVGALWAYFRPATSASVTG